MWNPQPPDPNWRRTARRALLGTAEPPETVILTPMGRIFRSIARPGTERSAGWLTTGELGRATVVWTPQGAAIADALAVLDPPTPVTFVGLCGSLRAHPLGSLLAISAATGTDGRRHTAHPVPELPHATNIQVTSLLEAHQRHPELTARADTVDLETATVLACANAFGLPARAILIVSDHNRSPSPFTAPPDPVNQALRTLPDQLLGWKVD